MRRGFEFRSSYGGLAMWWFFLFVLAVLAVAVSVVLALLPLWAWRLYRRIRARADQAAREAVSLLSRLQAEKKMTPEELHESVVELLGLLADIRWAAFGRVPLDRWIANAAKRVKGVDGFELFAKVEPVYEAFRDVKSRNVK